MAKMLQKITKFTQKNIEFSIIFCLTIADYLRKKMYLLKWKINFSLSKVMVYQMWIIPFKKIIS
jgi:hypothetical protein